MCSAALSEGQERVEAGALLILSEKVFDELDLTMSSRYRRCTDTDRRL
jgi:hypothetical protein